MDTTEHTELGNALRFVGWDSLQGNPYVRFDANGTLYLRLQALDKNGLPQPIDLNLSAGMIIGMSAIILVVEIVDFNLPSLSEFNKNPRNYDCTGECETLGEYLINEPVTVEERQKFINSYTRLANPNVKQSDIDTIYTINDANYIPFSPTLNAYFQQLMFAIRVKNYSEILNRNLSHFTPWSVRAYTLGHHLALKYATIYHELKYSLIFKNPTYIRKYHL